jgi:hypothetical protein
MSKIIITADWHAGVPKKLSYTMWAADVIYGYAKRHSISDAFILGDLFHDRVNLNIEVADAICRFFEAATAVRWHVFPGNHDMFLKHSWDVHAIRPFKAIINVVEGVGRRTLPDFNYWIIPFIHDEAEYMRTLAGVEKERQRGDVLLTHIGVNGASLNECFLIRNWSFVSFDRSKFERVFAGHFHCYQTVGKNVVYPGSPVAFRFDEGLVPHGFLVYDTRAGTSEFVDAFSCATYTDLTPPPKYLTVLDKDLPSQPSEFFAGNLVRVVLTHDYTKRELMESIERPAREMKAAGVSWVIPKGQDADIEAARKSEINMQAPGQLLDVWIKRDGAEGLDRILLAKMNAQIIAEAEERISAETGEE